MGMTSEKGPRLPGACPNNHEGTKNTRATETL